ncbi:hypothetical protein OL239_06970 [Arthrobacter sp. ATA002]|uniref:hypothetical protein n=1 Tax=Arthrobacter sp. ATA002 TaxID=2991715 RepID=UPI0022A72066|nr:hypothetical protein OL239_06970 [Arthrobacter sp. ATA002]
MKSDGEIMEILAAYDLTGSLRTTAELRGCLHHTVAKHVAARDVGRPIAEPDARSRVTDPFLSKIEEWIEGSKGRIRADKAHEKRREHTRRGLVPQRDHDAEAGKREPGHE